MHALAALSALLRIVVGDAACEAALHAADCAQPQDMADAPRLLASICGHDDDGRADMQLPGATPATAVFSEDAKFSDRMRVERSASWLHATASQLGRMLPPLFTVLRRHPRSSVRAAAVHAADEVLRHCARTLPGCAPACLECLLCLACDPWPQVADAACDCLRLRSSSVANEVLARAPTTPQAELAALLSAQLATFEAACKRGEADATVAARLLAGAIGVAGPALTMAVVAVPSRRAQLCHRLTTAFALSSRATQPAPSSLFVANEPMQLLASKDAAFLSTGMLLPRRHVRCSLLTSEEVRRFMSHAGLGRG